MTQIVAYGSSFNINNQFVPDIYLQVVPPQGYFNGAPTSIAAVIGTASWGPKNSPQLLSTPGQAIQTFGGVTAAALTDTHDLCTDVVLALTQATGQAGLSIYGVRVSDGTDVAATVQLTDTSGTPQNGMRLTAINTGTLGNQIVPITAAGQQTGTVTLTLVPFAGGGSVEVYPNLPGTGSTFWAAAQSAINNGLGPARGPSQLVVASSAATTTLAPKLQNWAMISGTDGRSVTSAQLIGSNASPPTGIYTLQSAQFTPSVMWVAGLTDNTVFSTVQAFCDNNNIFGLFAFASGTSVATAVSAKQTSGIYDFQIGYLLGWIYWFDSVNNTVRLVPPYAVMGGTIATLGPWQSPFNRIVQGIVGTERNSPTAGNQPYTYAELNSLGQAGIMTLSNPTPGSNQFGFRNGFNSVGNNQPTAFVEYSRTTNFLCQSIASVIQPFLGKLQGSTTNDPLRAKLSAALNTFLQSLVTAGFLQAFNVLCTSTNNTAVTVGQHQLILVINATYMSSVQYIFAQIQGGTTVQVSTNNPGQSLTNL